MKRISVLIASLLVGQFLLGQSLDPVTGTRLFDDHWLFSRSSPAAAETIAFDDSKWKIIDLPHDWSIEDLPDTTSGLAAGPFAKSSAGGPFTGYTLGGLAWYRKKFVLTGPMADKKIFLRFDGIYLHSDVWINGHHLGNHPNGYTPIEYELTPFLKHDGSRNVIAVRVSNEGQNSRWYSGSGIYRHVWLSISRPSRLVPDGIQITTPAVSPDHSTLEINTRFTYPAGMKKAMSIELAVFSPEGKLMLTKREPVNTDRSGISATARQIALTKAALWSPANPRLHRLLVVLREGREVIDSTSLSFGIRSIRMNAQEGLTVNGQRVILRGGCIHHDNGPLGSAAIERADERKLQILKANGFNAIRTSHNPPSPHFLDLCDRLGFLVIDEAFDVWEHKKLFDDSSDYHHFFNQWWKRDISDLVKRDRNHPSVFLWSIGNEIYERADPEGLAISKNLISTIRSLDNSRGITEGVCYFWDHPGRPYDSLQPVFALLDVAGYNYEVNRYEEEHRKFPDRVMAGTETFAMEIYDNDDYARKHPYVLGDFIWTAWDYIGEAGIGHSLVRPDSIRNDETILMPWPWWVSNCGDFDLLGNKKPQSYYRDVIWDRSPLEVMVEKPVPAGMKIVPNGWGWPDEMKSWTWPGQEAHPMVVAVYSKAEKIRVELNGKFVEEKDMSAANRWKTKVKIPYAPGKLTVQALSQGKVIAETSLVTVGEASRINLVADRSVINANGKDLSYVMVELTDAESRWVPGAADSVHFTIEGAGELAAVANGDPAGMQSFRQPVSKAFRGRCQLILRSGIKAGRIVVRASATGMKDATLEITTR